MTKKEILKKLVPENSSYTTKNIETILNLKNNKKEVFFKEEKDLNLEYVASVTAALILTGNKLTFGIILHNAITRMRLAKAIFCKLIEFGEIRHSNEQMSYKGNKINLLVCPLEKKQINTFCKGYKFTHAIIVGKEKFSKSDNMNTSINSALGKGKLITFKLPK